ncbi:MAG: ABC transporter ATP-binding protein [Planctomycetes bacterium]|nr:ABC transporter ATP-binding protein [Planctomycetota bacterium]
MDKLVRLVPYVWQQRGRLLVSVILAVAISLLWAGALLIVFPVVKVMLEGKSLNAYITGELQTVRANVERETTRKQLLESELASQRQAEGLPASTSWSWGGSRPSPKLARMQSDLLDCVSDLNHALGMEWRLSWLQSRVLPHLSPDRFTTLAQLMGLLLLLTGVKCIACYFQETLVSAVVERTMQTLRERLFRSTLKLDHQTLALETTPQLLSRFTFDLHQLAIGLSLLGNKAVIEPMKAATCIICAFGLNWRLTALSFACAPLAVLLFGHLGKTLKRASRRQMESMSRVYRALIEPLQSFPSVLAFRNERLHRRRLAKENQDYYNKAMRIVRIDALSSPSVEFLAMIGVFVGSLPGAYLVLRQETSIWGVQLAEYQMKPSELLMLYTLLAGVLDPARRIASIFSKVKKSSAAAERVFGWMDRTSLLTSARETVPLPRHRESIEFDHVTFCYVAGESGERPPALEDVTLTIPFGATVAVVGGNGSGKSTLASLLPRLFDPQNGYVRIDGVDISRVDPRELRRQIGIVTQDTLLFDTTIEENIRYGFPLATAEQLMDAARRAHVMKLVQQLPDGLQTGVGDRGHRLSGGQRQRVALARAILRDPAILILDEATSAVDAQSEQLIHGALGDLAHGRTTLIVTHAMTSTLLEHISHVLVMDQGRIAAFGPHESVLKTCPAYQRIYDAQIRRRVA